MNLYFSNRNLWNSYFTICLFSSICLFLFLLLVYKYVLLLIAIFLAIAFLIYLSIALIKVPQKKYISIDKDNLLINSPLGNKTENFNLSDVKNLRKNKHYIIFLCNENIIVKIRLSYLDAKDTKKLVNFLKYHPSINNKKFFS